MDSRVQLIQIKQESLKSAGTGVQFCVLYLCVSDGVYMGAAG